MIKINNIKHDSEVIKLLFDKPAVKMVIVLGAVLAAVYISGVIMNITTHSITSYKNLKKAINT